MKTKMQQRVVALGLGAIVALASQSALAGFNLGRELHNAAHGIGEGVQNVKEQVGNGLDNTWQGIQHVPQDLRHPQDIPGNIERETRRGLHNIDDERRRFLANIGDKPLMEWIEASRNQAIQQGVSPMPDEIYYRLLEFYPAEVLDRVSFRVGSREFWTLQSNAFGLGDASAITLGDVIVFESQEGAMDDVLWAHEVRHVDQYMSWGVERFAYHYLNGMNGVEGDANQAECAYAVQAYGNC